MTVVRFRVRALDILLLALFILSAAGAMLANEDPIFRSLVCSRLVCPDVSDASPWLKLAYNLSVASIASLIFYALLVRLPEHQKRQRIKRSFRRHYREFKEDCIGVMLGVVDGTYALELRDRLVNQKEFKEYFERAYSQGQDKWDALHNQMEQWHFDELITNLEILRDEMRFVLSSIDIPDEKPFEFLKRSSSLIAKMRDTSLDDYDGMKIFFRFLWEVFSGWSFITGYREDDVVEEMIKAI